MKIIKVVHDNNPQDIEAERQLFTLRSYQLESFLEGHQSRIMEQNQIKQMADEINHWMSFTAVAGGLGTLGKLAWNQIAGTKVKDSGAHLEPHKLIPQRVTEVIKATAHTLLQDISTQLQTMNEEVISLEAARGKYRGTHNLSIGTYTLHPYDGQRLTRLESYHRHLALEKDDELVTLLGRMGAKTLRIVESDTRQESGSGSLAVETIVADVKADASLARRVGKEKELLVVFEGKPTDIDPDLLSNSLWFANDSRLNAIFQSRRYSPNQIQAYTLRNTYTETFDFDFDLAARYVVTKIDLRAQYDSLSQEERFFHVEFGT